LILWVLTGRGVVSTLCMEDQEESTVTSSSTRLHYIFFKIRDYIIRPLHPGMCTAKLGYTICIWIIKQHRRQCKFDHMTPTPWAFLQCSIATMSNFLITSSSTRATARASNFIIIIRLIYQPPASRIEIILHKYKWPHI
jgi:hypothetical protein